jgi:hypothetical protein
MTPITVDGPIRFKADFDAVARPSLRDMGGDMSTSVLSKGVLGRL